MNPLDVRALEKSPLLDINEILSDFVSRMVGDPHRFHSEPAPKWTHRLIQCVMPWRKPKPGPRTGHLIPRMMMFNLRGSVPLAELCRSCRSVVPRALSHALEDTVKRGQGAKVMVYTVFEQIYILVC